LMKNYWNLKKKLCMKPRLFVWIYFFILHSTFAQVEIPVEQVVILALENNYDVRLFRNAADVAQTDRRYAKGAFLPQINGVLSTVYNENHQELRFQDEIRNNEGTAQSNNASASLQGNWVLFDGTRMFAVRKRLIETQEATELDLKQQMVNTVSDIITNYYDIVRQKQQLKATREQMSLNEERVKLADRRLQVGVGAKPELLQARVDYNALRTQALEQEALIVQLKERLNGLVNLKLPEGFDVADTILLDLGLELDQLKENVEYSNFGLQASQRYVRAAKTGVREANAQRSPTISLNGAYNISRLENTRLINPFGPLFSMTNGFVYGLTVNIPILNNYNVNRLNQQAIINVRRQELLYDQEKVAVNVALRTAFINYDNARKVLVIEEENISFARENVTIAFEVYKRGAATFVELRTAQQSLADAYNRLINARYLAKVAETELLRLTGSLIR
jgi:outer membrane protein